MGRDDANKVFVGGLPKDCATETLTEYFSTFGTITDSIVMTDRETGNSRGFGFVTFAERESLDQVMAMHGDHQIQGKWIDCKPATEEGSKGAPSKGGKGKGGGKGGKGGKGDKGGGKGGGYGGGKDFGGGGGYGAPPGGAYGAYNYPPPQYGAPPPGYGYPPPQYGAPPPGYGYPPPQYGAPPAYGAGGKGYAPY